ncbi:conserved hypothetical protein [Burkholderia cepacia]
MDCRQSGEFAARSHTLTMRLLDEAERQFEETRRLARMPWWVPLAVAALCVAGALFARAWYAAL